MERMRRRARALREMRTGEDLWKQMTQRPEVRRVPDQASLKSLRAGNPANSEAMKACHPGDSPPPISLGSRRAMITFAIIIGATILLLIIGRAFLN